MPAMRSVVKGMLEELGYKRVLLAEDGETAWRMIQAAHVPASGQTKTNPFGLIISDWTMAGMSGVDLLRAVRNFGPTRELPFLMMTSKNDQTHIAEALGAGVSNYIVKPFGAADLKERIEEIFSEE